MFKFLNTVRTQTLDPKHVCLNHMNGYRKHVCFFMIRENKTIFPTNLSALSCLPIS